MKKECTKQPFYRNKVAIGLRLFSFANLLAVTAVFLRGLYLFLFLGWTLGFWSTIYLIFAPIMIVASELGHTKAVEYGNYLFNQKTVEKHSY